LLVLNRSFSTKPTIADIQKKRNAQYAQELQRANKKFLSTCRNLRKPDVLGART